MKSVDFDESDIPFDFPGGPDGVDIIELRRDHFELLKSAWWRKIKSLGRRVAAALVLKPTTTPVVVSIVPDPATAPVPK